MPVSLKSRRGWRHLIVVLAVSVFLLDENSLGQSPAGAASQGKPVDAQQPSASIKVNSRLVVLDVIVSGEGNQPAHGLHPQDFTVLENNAPQIIRQFEEHTAGLARPPATLPKLPPNVFTNYTPAPEGGALNILLLDALNTPQSDQSYVRSQMLQYLKTIPSGTRMAIFGLSSKLVILQGFTSDPETLRLVISGKRVDPQATSLLADASQPSLSDTLSDDAVFGNQPGAAQMLANVQQFEAEQAALQTKLRVQYTLDGLNQLARYLAGIPGRKNLIWFSGSFPLSVMPDPSLADPFGTIADFSDELRKTTDLLAVGQVAVYPVDGRGLFNDPAMSASSNAGAKYGKNPGLAAQDMGKFNAQTIAEHATMDQMAEATGGLAFYNTNGLKQAVAEVIDLGGNYYTLAYSPRNSDWNGTFRKIEVKLAKAGYHLSYRRGYYADDPVAASPGSDRVPSKSMQAAMLRGAPDPTEIIFDLGLRPYPGQEDIVPKGNQPDAKLMKAPYRRYSVDFGVDMNDVSFRTTSDGVRHCALELTTAAYNANGEMLNSVSNKINADVKPDSYTRLLQSGLQFHQDLAVPFTGEYFVRAGVHDLAADKVGAIEVPTSSIKNIQAQAGAKDSR
jgi:VWFA-related protein